VGTVQPNNGLDAVFGAREVDVEFMPDIGDRIHFSLDGRPVDGGGFLQAYAATTGRERGAFEDGRVAVVENRFGAGRTLLVGTHPGVAYFTASGADNLRYFAEVFAWTGRVQQVRISNPALQARLHRNAGKSVLWVINSTREAQQATVAIDGQDAALGSAYWAEAGAAVSGASITVPPRDALVVEVLS
jgi:beta-galactosidase